LFSAGVGRCFTRCTCQKSRAASRRSVLHLVSQFRNIIEPSGSRPVLNWRSAGAPECSIYNVIFSLHMTITRKRKEIHRHTSKRSYPPSPSLGQPAAQTGHFASYGKHSCPALLFVLTILLRTHAGEYRGPLSISEPPLWRDWCSVF
jgi:hypothetical protein